LFHGSKCFHLTFLSIAMTSAAVVDFYPSIYFNPCIFSVQPPIESDKPAASRYVNHSSTAPEIRDMAISIGNRYASHCAFYSMKLVLLSAKFLLIAKASLRHGSKHFLGRFATPTPVSMTSSSRTAFGGTLSPSPRTFAPFTLALPSGHFWATVHRP
jgi:hypothetical protein